jgi:hypothetical protein
MALPLADLSSMEEFMVEPVAGPDASQDQAEALLGTAVGLLYQQGEVDIVELLLAVEKISYQWIEEDWGRHHFRADLYVDLALLEAFTDEVQDKIREAMDTAHSVVDEGIRYLRVLPTLVKGDWRTHYRAVLRTPSNQATLIKLPEVHPRLDNMSFRDPAELAVYQGLRRAQEQRPVEDTITIIPNPSVRLPGRTREPDFLVAYQGRIRMIEVDGASHRRKWASDKSRDQVFEDAGIKLVRRIDVEDTQDDRQIDVFVETFLRKLTER